MIGKAIFRVLQLIFMILVLIELGLQPWGALLIFGLVGSVAIALETEDI